jgi:hypothetical protein
MNTDLHNEEYPRLTPPDVVYEHKDALKKKAVVIPLYVKMVAAAAAVALLFGIFWFRTSLPEQELMAELKPVGPEQVQAVETMVLSESQAHFIVPKKAMKSSSVQPENTYKRNELPLLAELQPITAPALMPLESRPDLWMADEIYYASNDMPIGSQEEYYDDRSLISRGIAKMTDGECESLADILLGGLRSVKTELASLETTVQSSRAQLRQRVH